MRGDFVMHHCVEFSACDIWQLRKNEDFSKRQINIGFCPVCGKPVAELVERTRDGKFKFTKKVGNKADKMCYRLANEIDYKSSSLSLSKFRPKLYGWVYGVNKENRSSKLLEQYAYDFYGNKVLVKTIQERSFDEQIK